MTERGRKTETKR